MKTAIFLGAGASASEGAPSQANLFQEFFQIVKANELEQGIKKDIKEFFERIFDIDIDQDPSPATITPIAIAPTPSAQASRLNGAGSLWLGKSRVQILAKIYAAESKVVA